MGIRISQLPTVNSPSTTDYLPIDRNGVTYRVKYQALQGPQGPQGPQGEPGADGSVANLNVAATTLAPGSAATATYSNNLLSLGIPSGNTGATGDGIAYIEKTGTSGLVDTYTITMTSGSTFSYTVTNGSGGVWGNITGTLSSQTDLQTALNAKANSSNVYTKAEVNNALAAKLNTSDLLNRVYPVGSIYMSVNSTNPGTILGGTWAAFGEGRVLVGVDANDTDFNAAQKTGGEKAHTLTEDELPNITGDIQTFTSLNTFRGGIIYDATGAFSPHANQAITHAGRPTESDTTTAYATVDFDIGGDQPHNNMPPYITCYMWRRTA